MSIHLLIPLATMAINLSLIGVVFTRSWRVPGRGAFVTFLLTMAAWGGAQFAMNVSSSMGTALAWYRLLLISALLFPPLYMHFTFAFAARRPHLAVLLATYGAAGVGVILAFTGHMVHGLTLTDHGYVPRATTLFVALMPLRCSIYL